MTYAVFLYFFSHKTGNGYYETYILPPEGNYIGFSALLEQKQ